MGAPQRVPLLPPRRASGAWPDAASQWHEILDRAEAFVERLPTDRAGEAVLTIEGALFRGTLEDLDHAIRTEALAFHAGRIGGALPRLIDAGNRPLVS